MQVKETSRQGSNNKVRSKPWKYNRFPDCG